MKTTMSRFSLVGICLVLFMASLAQDSQAQQKAKNPAAGPVASEETGPNREHRSPAQATDSQVVTPGVGDIL